MNKYTNKQVYNWDSIILYSCASLQAFVVKYRYHHHSPRHTSVALTTDSCSFKFKSWYID